jgi:hypothetical protein
MKEWYIKIKGEQQGPYSPDELKIHPDVTPDTLVRKEGSDVWAPLSQVKELEDLFKDPGVTDQIDQLPEENIDSVTPDGLVIDSRREPPNALLWLLIAIFLLLYVFRLNWFS